MKKPLRVVALVLEMTLERQIDTCPNSEVHPAASRFLIISANPFIDAMASP
jgi:hypothetical protein